jgi:hypothetical protein
MHRLRTCVTANTCIKVRIVLVAVSGVAVLTAGCGSTSASSSAAQSRSSGGVQSQFAGKAGQRRFEVLAATICRTIRTGTPGRLDAKATLATLRRHAVAAAPAAERTIVSLKRLGTQTGMQSVVERAVADYQQLRALYATVSAIVTQKNLPSLSRSITLAEERASVDAQSSGLRGCAPLETGA